MKPEDAQRDRKALEIFGRAVEMASAEARAAYLDAACGGDATLKARVEALLANHVEDNFLQEPAAGLGPGATAIVPVTEQPGDRIGRYKLLQKIGEGGMGIVYMAEQEEPVRRQVALKIIKLGMDTRSVVARFEAERQALAMMDHPNIAKVIDAGATETGRPYFVMELMRGVPITVYCDKNHLGTTARLDLFIQVCHAIQHAHQKGVIHRDIKPSNVMVTLHDGVPVPKVIDFGIAKATGQRLTEKTLFTNYATMIGTPAYMSPEQAEMSGLDIDTRTDVYALGVLLYELLTGTTPFPAAELLSKGYGEMQRIIAEVEPERPSTRLSTMQNEERTVVAKNRGMDGAALGKGFKGDLDWIVMKCLEKDRTRRYETANGLAADLKRHLNSEPVVARPPSTAYRVQKFVRRNKVAVAAGGAVAIALVLGVAASTWLAVRATHERTRAEANASSARQAQVNEAREKIGAEQARSQAESNALTARRNLYASDMQLAHAAWRAGKIGSAMKLLQAQPPEFRGFDWRYVFSLCLASQSPSELLASNDSGFTAVGYSPDQRTVALGAGNGTVEVFDIQRRERVKRWQAHGGPIDDLTFHPQNANWLVTVSGDDGLLKVWEITNQRALLSTNGPKGIFAHLAFSPGGNILAAGAPDGRSVNLWGFRSGAVPALTLKTNLTALIPLEVAFAPDNRTVALCNVGAFANGVTLLDLPSGQTSPFPDVHGDLIFCAAFSPDGSLLATGGADELVVLWDVKSRTPIRTNVTEMIHVTSLAFAPDSQSLFAGGWDQNLLWWDLRTTNEPITLRGHSAAINALALSTNGQSLVSASRDGTARIWHPRGKDANPLSPMWEGFSPLLSADESSTLGLSAVFVVAVSPTQDKVAAGTPTKIILLDPLTGTQLASAAWTNLFADEGTNWFCGLAFSPDGETLALGSSLGKLALVDARTLVRRGPLVQPHTNQIWRIAYALNGAVLVTGGSFGDGVAICDAVTGNVLTNFAGIEGSFPGQPLAVSPDGQWLATGSPEQFVVIRDVASGKIVARSPQKTRFPHAIAFSPGGKLVVYSDELGGIFLWEFSEDRPLRKLAGHPGIVLDLAFSPDGRTLASTSMDHTIKLWHPEIEREVATLSGHAGWVWCVSFAQQGDTLLTGGRDGALKAWRAHSFEEIARRSRATVPQ